MNALHLLAEEAADAPTSWPDAAIIIVAIIAAAIVIVALIRW